jgi:Matrixin
VLFVWETADEQPDFGVDVAGPGGSAAFSWGDHPAVYVTGAVQLDATKLGKGLAQPQGNLRVQMILHEVGHLVGLDHINDQTQLMYREACPPTGL